MSSRRCARSAPRASRSCAPWSPRASSSACWPRSSGSCSASGSPRACSCSSARSASTCRRPPRSSRRRRSSSRSSSAPASRCWPASCPRGGRPACRRSRRSARARRCPRPGWPAQGRNAGLGVMIASLVAIGAGVFAEGASGGAVALLLGVGVLGLFAGIALLAPRLVKPLARVVGWPAKRAGGVAGELAGANAIRNPGRTASTAAALMIGLTLITVVAVLGAGFNATTRSAVTDQVRADHVIDGEEGVGFRASEGDTLAAVPGVTERLARAVRHRARPGRGGHDQRRRPGDDRGLLHVRVVGGLRTRPRAARDGRRPGHEGLRRAGGPQARQPRLAHHALGRGAHAVVRGIYDPPKAKQLLGPVSMSRRLRRRLRAAEEQLHVHRCRRRRGSAARGCREGARRRDVPPRRRVRRRTPRRT